MNKKIRLSETDKVEKLKFITALDENLCEKFWCAYAQMSSKTAYNEVCNEFEYKGYKLKISLSEWFGRCFYHESGKKGIDVVIIVDDDYKKITYISYPLNWSLKEKDMFVAKNDSDVLKSYVTKIAVSIIPTILEKDLINLFELQDNADCILFNEIKTDILQPEEVVAAFRERRIKLIKMADVLNAEPEEIELRSIKNI